MPSYYLLSSLCLFKLLLLWMCLLYCANINALAHLDHLQFIWPVCHFWLCFIFWPWKLTFFLTYHTCFSFRWTFTWLVGLIVWGRLGHLLSDFLGALLYLLATTLAMMLSTFSRLYTLLGVSLFLDIAPQLLLDFSYVWPAFLREARS